MEVQTYHLDVCHLRSLLDDLQHVAHVDAELILSQTRSDVSMGMGTHVGVQAEGHTSNLTFLGSQLVDDL